MKAFLTKLRDNKRSKLENLKEKIEKAETAAEVRSLSAEAQEIQSEIRSIEDKLNALDEGEPSDGADGGEGHQRSNDPVPTPQSVNPLGSYGQQRQNGENDMKYRNAFMEFVCRNTPIPTELRAAGPTKTSDVSATIPTTIVNEMIRKMKSVGNIYNLVRKTNVEGGVQIPILSLYPTAEWVTEGNKKDPEKVEAKTSVSFSYYGLECKMSQTIFAKITSLIDFETLFIELATESIMETLDKGVIAGTGSGQMLGITKDPRVTNVITLYETDLTWEGWHKKVLSKIPKSYRNGIFVMSQGTFESHINGLTDSAGQPIGRVNYGIDGGETYRFAGKTVETVDSDIIADFDTASAGDVFAIYGRFSDYVINSNMSLTVTRWRDNDTHEDKQSVMLIVDGKVADPKSFIIIKKGVKP